MNSTKSGSDNTRVARHMAPTVLNTSTRQNVQSKSPKSGILMHIPTPVLTAVIVAALAVVGALVGSIGALALSGATYSSSLTEFAAPVGIADITIDSSVFSSAADETEVTGDFTTYYSQVRWDLGTNQTTGTTYSPTNGSAITYTYKNAATLSDRTTADVIVTVKDFHITTSNDSDRIYNGIYRIFNGPSTQGGGSLEFNSINYSGSSNSGVVYGIDGTITVTVVDSSGNPVAGDLIFTGFGVNLIRSASNKAYNTLPNFAATHNWSEQVEFSSATSNVYIPQGRNRLTYDNSGSGVVVYPSTTGSGADANLTYESGYATSLSNGTAVTFRSSAQTLSNGTNYFFKPGALSHTHDFWSSPGGTIQTTKGTDSNHANANGALSDSTVLDPGIYSVADGKDVTYTLTPEPGYRIRKIEVDGTTTSPTTQVADEGTGKLQYYTLDITDDNNHEIFVEWEPIPASVNATKEWDDESNKYNNRPSSLTMELSPSGILPTTQTITNTTSTDSQNVPGWGNNATWTEGSDTVIQEPTTTGWRGAGGTTTIFYSNVDYKWYNYTYDATTKTYTKGSAITDTIDFLPKYDSSWELIDYQVTENGGNALPGYTTTTSTNHSKTAESDDALPTAAYKYTLVNSTEYTTFTLNKKWVGDSSSVRPSTSDFMGAVSLLLNGSITTDFDDSTSSPTNPKVTDNGNNTYTVVWSNLPTYVGGSAASYTAQEQEANVPTGYQADTTDPVANGGTITNTAQKDVSITKVWDDNSNEYSNRPGTDETTKIAFTLYNDGSTMGSAVSATPVITDNGDGTWTITWKNMPTLDDNGKPITYYAQETATPDGYEISDGAAGVEALTEDSATDATSGKVTYNSITNATETIYINVVKEWDDSKYSTGDAAAIGSANEYKRTDVTFTLSGGAIASGSEPTQTVASSAESESDRTKTFAELPTYVNGSEASYTVTENTLSPDAWTADSASVAMSAMTPITDSNGNVEGYKATIKNTPKDAPKYKDLEITIHKTDALAGGNLEGAVFSITDPDGNTSTVTTAGTGGVAIYTITKPGDYTVTETTAPTGYELSVDRSYTLTVDKDLTSIKLSTDQSFWEWLYNLFISLFNPPVADGVWDETSKTLTFANEPKTATLTVQKVWSDTNNQDGKRVAALPFVLQESVDGADLSGSTRDDATQTMTPISTTIGDGEVAGTLTWELPLYKNGKQVTYSVLESTPTISDYTQTYSDNQAGITLSETGENKITVTNKYTPETVDIDVVKVWDDNNNQDGLRADADILLKKQVAGSTAVTTLETKTAAVTASTADNTTVASWTGQPAFESGNEITYTVEETAPDGYTARYEVTYESTTEDGGSFGADTVARTTDRKATVTVTNTHEPETKELTVTKTWVGVANGNQPTTTDLGNAYKLYQVKSSDDSTTDVTASYTPAVSRSGLTDTLTWSGLPAKANKGQESYTYYAVETPVSGYLPATYTNTGSNASETDKAYDGATVTNVKEPTGNIEVSARKVLTGATKLSDWADSNNETPFVFELLINGATGEAVVGSDNAQTQHVTVSGSEEIASTAEVTFDKVYFKAFAEDKTGSGDWGSAVYLVDASGNKLTGSSGNELAKLGWLDDSGQLTGVTMRIQEQTISGKNGLDQPGSQTITLTITDQHDGTLDVASTTTGDVDVLNEHEPDPATVSIKLNKKLTGRDLSATDFTFEATYDDSAVSERIEKDRLLEGLGATTADDAKKTVSTLSNIDNSDDTKTGNATMDFSFSKTGTYTFKVTEKNESKGGITYDNTEYTVTFEVTMNDDGTLSATPKVDGSTYADDAIVFSNNYDASSNATVEATKHLQGTDWEDEMLFRFKLTPKEASDGTSASNMPKPAKATLSVDSENPTASWDIPFTLDHVGNTYTYTIQELTPGWSGYDDGEWTNDLSEHTVAITVADAGDGTLSFTYTYDGDASIHSLDVVNTKASTEVVLRATKNVTDSDGNDGNYWKSGTTYELVLEPVTSGAPMPDSSTGRETVTATSSARTQSFPLIRFDSTNAQIAALSNGEEVTFEYNITETQPASNPSDGVTYDTNTYKAFVKIAKDTNGVLQAPVVTYDTTGDGVADGSTPPTFTNKYESTGTVEIKALKVLEGGSLSDFVDNNGDSLFSFTLYESDGTTVAKDVSGNEITGIHPDVSTGVATLGTLAFDEHDVDVVNPGTETTKTYILKEDSTSANVVADTDSHPITVTLKDNGDGTITATAAAEDGTTGGNHATVNNTYEAEGSQTLEVKKFLDNRPITRKGFSFTLEGLGYTTTDVDTSDVSALQNVVENSAWTGTAPTNGTSAHVQPSQTTFNPNGQTSFGEINYSMDDLADGSSYVDSRTFVYKVTEAEGDNSAIDYDKSEYYAFVTVSNADKDGTLDTSVVYLKKASDGSYSSATEMLFTNTYTASGEASVNAIKKITTRDWTTSDEFTFTIEPWEDTTNDIYSYKGAKSSANKIATSDVPLPSNATNGKAVITGSDVAGDKMADFASISYTDDMLTWDSSDGILKARFFYKITENTPLADGFTQTGQKVFYAMVTVTDNRLGGLETRVYYYNEKGDVGGANENHATPVFQNEYTVDDDIEIPVTKLISGRNWEDGDSFSFTLSPIGTAPVPTSNSLTIAYADVTSETGAKSYEIPITLANLTQTTASEGELQYLDGSDVEKGVKYGTFTYQIVEDESTVDGVDEASDPIYVKVVVIDKLDGTVEEQVSYYTSFDFADEHKITSPDDSAQFTNKFRETKDVQVVKTWNDAGDSDAASRPDVTLHLFRTAEGGSEEAVTTLPGGATLVDTNGDEITSYSSGSVTVAADKLPITFKNLPAVTQDDVAYTYSITEDELDGYVLTDGPTSEDADLDSDGETDDQTISLTNTKSTKVKVTKVWHNSAGSATEVAVALHSDKAEGAQDFGRIKASNNWSYTFDDLPMYTSDGEAISYTVAELGVPAGYESAVTYKDSYAGTWSEDVPSNWTTTAAKEARITNTELTDVEVTKTWVGIPTNNITFELYRKAETTATTPDGSGAWSETDGWEKVTDANGNAVTYTFPIDDFTASDTGDSESYTFTQLPKYDANGTQYTYRVYEATSDNDLYTAEQSENLEITNTNAYKSVGTIDVNVAKELVGRTWISSGANKDMFYFKIEPVKDANGTAFTDSDDDVAAKAAVPKPDLTNDNWVVAADDATTVGAFGHNVDFGNITFSEGQVPEGGSIEVYYKIYETDANGTALGGQTIDGVTYDDSTQLLRVVAADDGSGNIVPSLYWNGSDTASAVPVFVNTYDASAEVLAYIVKHIDGRDYADGDSFEFTITNISGAPLRTDAEADATTDATPTTVGPVSNTEGTYVEDADGTYSASSASEGSTKAVKTRANIIKLSDLSVDPADGIAKATFIYEMSEVEPASGKVEDLAYDGSVIYLKLDVVDNQDGTLGVTQGYYTDAACTKPLKVDGDTPQVKVDDSGAIVDGATNEVAAAYFENSSIVDVPVQKVWDGVPVEDVTIRLQRALIDVDEDTEPTDDQVASLSESDWTPVARHIVYRGDFYTGSDLNLDSANGTTSTLTILEEGFNKGLPLFVGGKRAVYRVVEEDTSDSYTTTYKRLRTDEADKTDGAFIKTGDTLVVTNTTSATNTANIAAVKQLLGRQWLEDDEFEFTLTPAGKATYDEEGNITGKDTSAEIPMPADDADRYSTTESDGSSATTYAKTDTQMVDTEGTLERLARFGAITYTMDDLTYVNNVHVGDFYYTMTEVAKTGTDAAGISYSTKESTVHVHVVENRTNELTVQIAYDETTEGDVSTGTQFTPVFTNTYDATGTESVSVDKYLMGRAWVSGETFEFTATPLAGAPFEPADDLASNFTQDSNGAIVGTLTVSDTSAEHQTLEFPEITFTLDDLGKTVKSGDSLSYSNGDAVPEGMAYDRFMYGINETGMSANDLKLDADTEYVQVTVIDKGDGTLDTSVKIFEDRFGQVERQAPGTSDAATSVVFVNQATRDIDVVKTWKGTPPADAVVDLQYRAKGGSTWVTYEQYIFAASATPDSGSQTTETINGLVVPVATYTHSFEGLPVYLEDGDNYDLNDVQLEWRIVEIAMNGVTTTYGDDATSSEPDVEDDVTLGGNTTVEDLDSKLAVCNVYVADIEPTTAQLSAVKELNGRDWTSSDEFTFTVEATGKATYDANGNITGTDESEETLASIPLPSSNAVAVDNVDAKYKLSDSQRQSDFGPISYEVSDLVAAGGKMQGDFYYTMSEVVPSGATDNGDGTYTKDGVTYTAKTYDVHVHVESAGDYLTAEVSYDNKPAGGAVPVFTNTYDATTTDVEVRKVWDDTNNQDGERPTSVEVALYADDEPATDSSDTAITLTLSADNNWKDSFKDLPAKTGSGDDIAYSVRELDGSDALTTGDTTSAGYSVSIAGSEGTGYTITNSLTPGTTSVTATKVWDDGEGGSAADHTDVVVRLFGMNSDGEVVYDGGSKTIEMDDSGEPVGSVTWTGLPKRHYSSTDLTWTVVEKCVAGYTSEVSGDAENGFVVTNTYVGPTTQISVDKEWADNDNVDGVRPTSVTYQLKQKVGDTVSNYGEAVTVAVADDGSAPYTWYDLPVTASEETTIAEHEVTREATQEDVDAGLASEVGEEITETVAERTENPSAVLYYVEETQADGYDEPVVVATAPGEFKVINARSRDTIEEIKVVKAWADDDDSAGLRPHEVVFELTADGDVVDELVLTEGTGWQGSFTNLPVHKDGEVGSTITYSVQEQDVDRYTASDPVESPEGTFTITNSLTPETITVKVEKVWEDGTNTEEHPEVVFHLLRIGADGATLEVPDSTFTIAAGATGDDLKHSWTGLPKVVDGSEVTYAVVEDSVEGYGSDGGVETVSDDGSECSWVFTNTYVEPVEPSQIVNYVDPLASDGSMVVKATQYATPDEAQTAAEDGTDAPSDPSHSGYEFVEWVLNQNAFGDYIMVAKYAQIVPAAQKVVSYVDPLGGSESGRMVKSELVDADAMDSVSAPSLPTHSGWTATEWVLTKDAAGNWIYTAVYEHNCEVTPSPTPTPSQPGSSGTRVVPGTGTNVASKPAVIPETGDPSISWTILAGVALVGIALVIVGRKGRKG